MGEPNRARGRQRNIKPGQITTEIISGLDWFPTLLSAAGDPGVKDRLLKGWRAKSGGLTFKNHLDGYDQLAFLEGKQPKSARNEFFYFDDSGGLVAVRSGNMKFVFCEQRMPGTLAVWAEPFTCLRAPKMFNLRMDPFERASTFKAYPPRQRPSSFSVDQIMEKFTAATTPPGGQ